MRAVMRKILLFAIPLLLMVGCAKELEIKSLQDEPVAETPVVEEDSGVTVIHAGFEYPETKTHLGMNDAGTVAKVLWTRNDKIYVAGITGENQWVARVYETQDDGVTDATFTCNSWNPDGVQRFYAMYPSDSFVGASSGQIGVYIPSVQQAVKDNIEEGLNIAYASAESLSGKLFFRNIPALIGFKLSGSIVGSLSQIKFRANTSIVGDIMLKNADEAVPTYNMNSYYNPRREKAGSTVVLNGPFEEGAYYYIAVFPGTTEGFTMYFSNSDGDYVVKTSSKSLTTERSHITDLGTINVGDSFGDPLVTQYKTKSTTSEVGPVDIVVIPDGFTKNQRELFESRARDGIDFLFGTEPYKSYEDYFNVYFIWAPSKDEGASVTDGNGHVTEAHDTAFGSRWGKGDNNYGDMQADADKVFGFVSSHCPEIIRGELTIDQVPVLLIINDTRYGGRAISYSSGRTYCLAPFTRGGGDIYWSYPSKSGVLLSEPCSTLSAHPIEQPVS